MPAEDFGWITDHPWMPEGQALLFTKGYQLGDTWKDIGYTEGGIMFEQKPAFNPDAFAAMSKYIEDKIVTSFTVPWASPQHDILADILEAKALVEQAKAAPWKPLIVTFEPAPFTCGYHEGQALIRDEARSLCECPVYGCAVRLTDEDRQRLEIAPGTVIFTLG